MILKKQLRFLICTLQCFYVLAGNNSIRIDGYETTDDTVQFLSFDYIESTTNFEIDDAYLQSFKKDNNFLDETTETHRNELLPNVYPNSNDVSTSSGDALIIDFVEKFKHGFSATDKLNDNEIFLLNDAENKQSICNATVIETGEIQNFVVSSNTTNLSSGVPIKYPTCTNRYNESSKPHVSKIVAGIYSLSIYWESPEGNSTCIKYYRVTICPQEITKSLTDTNVTITDLHACTPYSIYINSVYEDNNEGSKTEVDAKTLTAVPTSPLLYVNNVSVSKNEIFFPWKIEKNNSNCVLSYLETICNYVITDGHGYDIMNGTTLTPINTPVQDTFLTVNSIVEGLSPYTTYSCSAHAVNEAGTSEFSSPINITTSEDIPSVPELNVMNITYSQFIIAWKPPIYLAGNLHDFEIILEWEERFPVPDWCEKLFKNMTKSFNGSTFSFEYTEAIAYTNYKTKIRAKTGAGWGNYSEYLIFQTPPKVPDVVTNLSLFFTNNKNNTNTVSTILTWGFPCLLNGKIEYFNVFVHGTRINYPLHSFSIKKSISYNVTKNYILVMNLVELQAEYNYTVEVSAKVEDVQELGVSAKSTILFPAGIPFQPDEEYIKSITIDPSKARRTTTSATLLLPLFPDTNGDIIFYSIIVSKAEHSVASHTKFNLTNHTWPSISSWEEAMLQDFTIPYQATRLYWNPYPNYVADYGDVKAVKYTLGEDTSCEEISSNTNKRVYCNGPLKPNMWYHVRMRAFTCGGYTDSTIFLIKTNAEINIGLVSGVVFGILFLGILTTIMLLVRKCSPQVILQRFLHSDMSGSPVPVPFSKKKFIVHCQQLIDNPGKLSNEFQLLQTLSVDLQMPTNNACLQANKKKNRYSDILPYDFSRVKLEVIDNDPNTDYINASFIRGYTGEDEYIACQGPKEETTFDFWRMVEQYNINVIVMLTQFIEKGKEKCYQYFPTIRETFRYENMTIKCTSELDYRYYTQRTLVLQKENKKRYIIHLHFKDWPDHDVPEDFDPMIHFCQVIRRHFLANKGYIVIHCSAGIGRTGTLIAVDILLQNLRDNRKIDVFGTVYRLRHHRINMVQKESQYAYIYNCIKQVLKNPYCFKSYKPPPMDPLSENTSKKSKTISNSKLNLVNNFEYT